MMVRGEREKGDRFRLVGCKQHTFGAVRRDKESVDSVGYDGWDHTTWWIAPHNVIGGTTQRDRRYYTKNMIGFARKIFVEKVST